MFNLDSEIFVVVTSDFDAQGRIEAAQSLYQNILIVIDQYVGHNINHYVAGCAYECRSDR